jgi:hypothetical protein
MYLLLNVHLPKCRWNSPHLFSPPPLLPPARPPWASPLATRGSGSALPNLFCGQPRLQQHRQPLHRKGRLCLTDIDWHDFPLTLSFGHQQSRRCVLGYWNIDALLLIITQRHPALCSQHWFANDGIQYSGLVENSKKSDRVNVKKCRGATRRDKSNIALVFVYSSHACRTMRDIETFRRCILRLHRVTFTRTFRVLIRT